MIYIIIPVYNRKEFTRKCIESLLRQSYRDFKVIVVDDGSTDNTDEMVKTEFPDVMLLKGDGNLFWTAGVNLGIAEALKHNPEYVMTLNNDTVVAEDFLEKMIFWGQKSPESVLGSLELDADTEKPIYGGEVLIDWDWKHVNVRQLLDELPGNKRNGLHKTSFFPGRGLLIPNKVFQTIGLFDAVKFPHYYADYDFTLRAANRGFPIYCNYDAHLYTFPQESGGTIIRKKKTLKNYYRHLFNIRGGGNLRDFTYFTLRHCPKKDIPLSLIAGYARRMVGYWTK